MESNSVLLSIIWFYETLRQSGTVIGPLIPLITHSLDIQIFNSGWKIDKLNITNVVLAFVYFCVLCVCHTKVYDVSKIYDQMFGRKYYDNIKKQDPNQNEKTPTTKVREVMKWKNLFQIDILSIVLSVSLSRYASTICNLVVIATKFSWSSDKVYPLTMASSIVFIALLSVMNGLRLFSGKPRNVFFIFVLCLLLMASNLTSLLLTATNLLDTLDRQYIYLAILRLTQSFAWFQTNTLGNFLLFRLVDPKDSSFVAGFRGLLSSMIKSVAQGLVFTTVYSPGFSVPWIVVGLVVSSWIILYRRFKYFD